MVATSSAVRQHEYPTELPPELVEHWDRLLFARWLVLTGRLSDSLPVVDVPVVAAPHAPLDPVP